MFLWRHRFSLYFLSEPSVCMPVYLSFYLINVFFFKNKKANFWNNGKANFWNNEKENFQQMKNWPFGKLTNFDTSHLRSSKIELDLWECPILFHHLSMKLNNQNPPSGVFLSSEISNFLDFTSFMLTTDDPKAGLKFSNSLLKLDLVW